AGGRSRAVAADSRTRAPGGRDGSCRPYLLPPPEVRVLGVVDAAVAPRVAAKEAPRRENGTLEEPVGAEGVDRVLRAARVVLACPRGREQPERVAPGVDEADPDVLH